jgi:cell division septal protein FtsQ
MSKKRIKKKKVKFLKIFLIIFLIFIISYIIYYFFTMPIKNIYIINNNILTDQYIIEKAKINNYPSFLMTFKSSIKNRLLKESYIKEVNIEKEWFGQVYIEIIEYNLLFYNRNKEVIVLENKTEVSNNKDINNIPILINYVPDTIYEQFIEKMNLINDNVKMKISEIEYNPNNIDEGRFLLKMNDNNYVYLTLYKFEIINNYNDILPTLENKKGILYLDSGNYFDIFE